MKETVLRRDLLMEPFPEQEIHWREGFHGRRLPYLKTGQVIRRLNEAAPSWDFRIARLEWHDELLIAIGELTIPGLGTRSGIGVQRYEARSEDVIKGAASDALKKAATLFGVGLDLVDELPPMETTDGVAGNRFPSRAAGPTSGDVWEGSGTLTPRQRGYIFSLARQLGWLTDKGDVDRVALDSALVHIVGDTLDDLSQQQASMAIDALKEQLAQRSATGAIANPHPGNNPVAAIAEPPQLLPADDDDVSWTTAWKELRALGVTTKAEAVDLLGGWSDDPREVRRMVAAARARL